MRYTAAVKFYGSAQKVAEAAGVSKQAVSLWKKRDRVPLGSARRLETRSGGRLKIDAGVYVQAHPTAGGPGARA
jgi:DNA-binding transcriptional regulator Cro